MLAIEVVLRTGRYDAATSDTAVSEWPPHPARLFNALVASAESEEDFNALEALERLDAPAVHASRPSDTAEIEEHSFVVANSVEKGGGNMNWPGRTNGLRRRVGRAVREPAFAMTWDGDLPADAVARLARMAERVPYVGRVSSEATVRMAGALPERSWSRFEPVSQGRPGTMLRVPGPGYVAQLRAAYADGRRAREVETQAIPYRLVEPASTEAPDRAEAVDGPFTDLVVFGFEDGVSITGDRVVQVTSMLRKAVMKRISTDVPALVSGHGANGRDHVAFLALPNVGYARSDGRLHGVALALPRTLVGEDRRRLLRVLVGANPFRSLRLDRTTEFKLVYDPSRPRPVAVLAERWTGAPPKRRWVTATPLMLDRFPKRGDEPARMVAKALVRAGYPEPEVEVSPAPLARGALHRPRPGSLPQKRPRRPLLHARVTFPKPVRGPVVAGSMRYLGLGLFAPVVDEAAS